MARKPYLVLCAAPFAGHTTPMINLAAVLVKRGFKTTFIGGEEFKVNIEQVGARHVSLPPPFTQGQAATRVAIPAGLPRLIHDMNVAFVGTTAPRFRKLIAALEMIRGEDSSSDVVILTDPMYMGANPLLLGAPLPRGYRERPKVIGINHVPYIAYSAVTGPFGPGLPPDGSESGLMRNKLIHDLMVNGPFSGPIRLQKDILRDLGATTLLPEDLMASWLVAHDVLLQMCPPSLEYDRPDLIPIVKFAGCLPPRSLGVDFEYPAFWDELTCGNKQVVVVTQGTVATVYTDLVIPTIQGLAARKDLLVVAILGKRGATLPNDTHIPVNTRVVDYLAYDAILPYAGAFVMNAGYGGLLHGITHGVPMVLAGETEDKPEVAMRGEHAGIAINLRTGKPEAAKVAEAVNRVLAELSFKERAMAIREENEMLGTIDIVERHIMDLVA